ncbi:glycosyltransferase family 4 protein [Halosimplex amylolyticum]|uniref:glycosyltransferase family 4 protein n=1 Tax=Halosimplex amylolyticum TaxID=3396616 RepID=UPI003F578BFB
MTVLHLDAADGGKRAALSAIADLDPDVLYFRILKDLPLATVAKLVTDAHVAFNVSHDAHCLPRFAGWPGRNDETAVHGAYRRLKLAFLRSLLSVPDTVFTQTLSQRRLLRENRDIDSVLTGNGHPVPDGEPEKHDPPVVLWLASIKEWKQPLAFADVAEACTDLPCEFWIVGQPAETSLTEEIVARTEKVSNLEYLGGCSVEESNDYLEQASVFVNTSKQEGFPNTFIQAWLRKTPVVSLNVDPANHQGEGETGFYGVETRSALADRVRELIERPEHRNQLAERAYSYARDRHDIANVVDEIERALPDKRYQ